MSEEVAVETDGETCIGRWERDPKERGRPQKLDGRETGPARTFAPGLQPLDARGDNCVVEALGLRSFVSAAAEN